MWTEEHRARHEPRLTEMVSACTVEEMARWLERADPPRSATATPYRQVVAAITWHLRVGGGWRTLPSDFPPWRTVYGWFRRWLVMAVFDRLLRDVACLRRRAAGRAPEPSLGIIDTQSVKCIPVRGPRGYDAGKKVLGRKRVALVDAEGIWLGIAVVPANVQDRDTLPALDAGKAAWPSLREIIFDGSFTAERCQEPSAARNGATCMAPAITSLNVTPVRRASSSWHAAGWSSAASAGSSPGAVCCATVPGVWMSPPRASPSPPSSPGSRRCSTPCQLRLPQAEIAQTGS